MDKKAKESKKTYDEGFKAGLKFAAEVIEKKLTLEEAMKEVKKGE